MPGLRTRTRMQVRVPQCSPRAHACSRSTMLHSHSPQGLENYRRSRTWTTLRRPHPVCRGKSLVRPRRRSWLTSDFGFFILSAAMNLPGRHTGNLNLIFMTARAMITPAGLAVLNSSLPSWFNVRAWVFQLQKTWNTEPVTASAGPAAVTNGHSHRMSCWYLSPRPFPWPQRRTRSFTPDSEASQYVRRAR